MIGSEIIRKVEEHMPDGSDPTLLVLKAHLLVEEQLIKFTEEIAQNSQHISNTKLTFPQRVKILQAFLPIPVPKQFFQAALLLNKIRNKMAHTLIPEDLQFLERDFIQKVFESSCGVATLVVLPHDPHHEKFKTALVMLVVGLSAARSALPTMLASVKR